MNVVFYFVARLALFCLYLIDIAMLIRAILSWFPGENDSRLLDFVYTVTEPFLIPFRLLFHKLNWFAGMPLDMSFLFANFTLYLVTIWLSSGL